MNSPQYISEVLSDSSYTTTHNYSKTPTPEYQSDEKIDLSELNLELQNKKNSECEKSNKKCINGLCYCFSSDSDDVRIKPKFIRKTARLSSESSFEPNKSSDDSSVFNECANSRSKLNKSDSIVLRARGRRKKEGVKIKRRVKSNENFVEKKNCSFKRIIIRITSMREESSEESSESQEEENISEKSESQSEVEEEEEEDEEPPLLRIVQEITQTKTVSSKVTVNKAKLREMNESKKKRENIIDDNFCNEILDKTLNWERLEEEILSREIKEKNKFSFGKLEASPKYSGKNVGRLLAKRNKRAEKIKKNIYKETVICGSERTFSEEYVSTDSNSNRTGPKKPPRTFASNSSKIGGNSNTTMELDEELDLMRRFHNLKASDAENIGWTFLANNPKKIIPTCPTLEDINWVGPEVVEEKIGWTFLDQNKANSPPQHILNMLDFDDRKNNQLISSFLKAEQQVVRNVKEDIDTVDGLKSPIRNDFENFVANTTVKSTPREGKHQRRIPEEINGRNLNFSENENFCPNCSKVKKPKKSLAETTIKRTKSFFETTQRKINFKSKKSKSIESVDYSTPQKNDLTTEANKNQFSGKKFNKNLNCDDCPPEKPIRRSLMKDSKTCSENSTPNKNVEKPIEKDYFNFNRIIKSPKTRFCLDNLRTPKKLFTTPKKSENVTPSYKSYADRDQDITALMGEFLLNMSTHLERKTQKLDDEPIYEEIRLPRARKSLNENFLESSKNHFTVNNDLYAKIDFNKKFKKSKSLSNLQKSPELNNSINSIKNKSNTTLFNSNLTINDISPIKNSNLNLQAQIHMEPTPIDDGNYFQNSELNFMENNSVSSVGGRKEVSSYDASKFLRAALGDDMVIGSRDSIQYVDEDDFTFYPENKVSVL